LSLNLCSSFKYKVEDTGIFLSHIDKLGPPSKVESPKLNLTVSFEHAVKNTKAVIININKIFNS
jgi:hypothetical protein